MKLSKKIISVLLSTSYMFTSIVFADGPEETPKTGTTKLEKMFLTNVAQYMPMKDKIKLEQVNKFCADSLKMGYADDFLYVYILLNASVDESGHRKLVSSYDFGIATKAFKNSIRHCCFKETAEVSTISDEFRSLYRINNHNSYNVDKPHDIIFPRAYNLTFDGAERIVKIYGALEGKNNTEIAIKKFIKTKIFDNGEFTTSVKDIQQLKKNLEDGLLSRLKKLEIDLNNKLDDAPLGQYHNCLHLYFTLDKKAIIDSAPRLSNIESSMLQIYAGELVDYSLEEPPNLDSDIEETLRVVGDLPYTLELQMMGLHTLAELAWVQKNCTRPNVEKKLAKTEYDDLQNLYLRFEHAFNNQNYEIIKNIKNQYIEKIKAIPLTAKIFADSSKPEQEVFDGYLTKKINGLKPETSQFLYEFFCTLKDSKACRLYEVRSIIDELVNTNEIQPLDFAVEDIHRTPLSVSIRKHFIKTYVLPHFKNLYEAKYEIRYISKMFNITDSIMDLDALQTVVYIMYKLGCEPAIIQNMQNALLATYVPNNSEDFNKIKRIFKTAGKGKPKHLDKNLGTIEYTLSRIPISEEKSPRNNFGTALVGVTGLSALGALVYNGINKYKNKPSNISESKNNKNINKKIAKNIS